MKKKTAQKVVKKGMKIINTVLGGRYSPLPKKLKRSK